MDHYLLVTKDNLPVLTLNNDLIQWPRIFERHCHRMQELSLAKSGEGVYCIDGREYEIHPGDVFIIGNTEHHQLIPNQDVPIVNMSLHIDPDFICMPFESTMGASFLNVFNNHNMKFTNRLDGNDPATKTISALLLELECEADSQAPYYHLKVRVLLEMILIEILRNFDYFNLTPRECNIRKADIYRINDVLDHINYNISQPLTLNDLAKIACVSPAYFSSIFKRYYGIALFEYIAQKRVEYARSLLRTSSYSITEIAQICGFNNSTSFNKTFQRIMGCTPSFMRKNITSA